MAQQTKKEGQFNIEYAEQVNISKVSLQLMRAGNPDITRGEVSKIIAEVSKPIEAAIKAAAPRSKITKKRKEAHVLYRVLGSRVQQPSKREQQEARIAKASRKKLAAGTATKTQYHQGYIAPSRRRFGVVKKQPKNTTKQHYRGVVVAHLLHHGANTTHFKKWPRNPYFYRIASTKLPIAAKQFQEKWGRYIMKRLEWADVG